MKKIVINLFITLFFIGCGKYEPKLPQSYDDVSFVELMEVLHNNKISDNTYSSDKWFSANNGTDISKYIRKPFASICKNHGGDINHIDSLEYKKDFLSRLHIEHPKYLYGLETRKEPINFTYCRKDDKVLFGYLEFKFSRKLRDYKSDSAFPKYFWHQRYTYSFDNSASLTLEVNKETKKANQEQDEYLEHLEEYEKKARNKEQKKIQYGRNKAKLDHMFIEKFHEPSKEQLKNGYVETEIFSIIDRYEFKHHNGNIPDVIFHKQCDKVCSKYNNNLKDILDGNLTLVNKEPFTKTIATQAQYGMYNFDVSCICFGNKYRIKEYIWNER